MDGKETSVKQMLLKIVQEGMTLSGIEEGLVTKSKPLLITLIKDKKIKLSIDDLVIPERLTDHEVIIMLDGTKKKIEVKNALNVGDKVNLLQYNDGKIYYVLDRA